MSDVCFSGSALVLLTAVWGVVSSVTVTIFWLFVKSQQASITRAQKKEDDALANLNKAVSMGNVMTDVVQEELPRRRR